VKQCRVEVYLQELRLCKDFNLETEIHHKFSKSDTIGKFSSFFMQVLGLKGLL
jgi:hypothetical protein